MMHLIFLPTDQHFAQNLHQLRQASVTSRICAPDYLMVVVDGRAVDTMAARVRPSGMFSYTDQGGEHNIPVDRVDKVEAFFTTREKRRKKDGSAKR